MIRPIRWITLLFCMVLATLASAEIVKVENPQALPVIDKANVLTQDQITSLSTRLLNLASTDGTQVAVLVVPTTGDEDMFTFAQRTATEWGIGQAKNNSGALFAVAINDRQSRIHVGYGLEGRLTDALSKRILSTEVSPRFKEGNYYAGLSQGVDSIIAVTRGEYTAPVSEDTSTGGDAMFYFVVFGLVFFFVWTAIRDRRGGGRGGRGGRGGPGVVMLPNIWTTGGHGSGGGWGHSGGDSGGGGFGGGFGGGDFGGGGAGDSW